MTNLVYAVTGANGYVGSVITKHLRKNGYRVCELTRTLSKGASMDRDHIPYSLETAASPDSLRGIDILIHCAYDFKLKEWEEIDRVNIKGSVKLFEAAKTAQVKKIILISTQAAFEGCKSLYGKAKFEIEKCARPFRAVIVRGGLVYGKNAGGAFGGMAQAVEHALLVPLFGKGNQSLHLTHEDDLCHLVFTVSQLGIENISEPILAASERPKTMKEIFQITASAKGKKIAFIPIPLPVIRGLLEISERCKINLGFNRDNLVNLENPNPNPSFDMTRKIGVAFREFNSQTVLS